MRVLKNQQITEIPWRIVDDEQDLPSGNVVVPVARFQTERKQLLGRESGIGIKIDGNTAVETIAGDLDHFGLIALGFPTFPDGRCFTHARLLRERYRYKNDILAVGDVLRDQLFFMERCGINLFLLRDDKDIDDALNAFGEFSVKYQSAADGAEPIYRHR